MSLEISSSNISTTNQSMSINVNSSSILRDWTLKVFSTTGSYIKEYSGRGIKSVNFPDGVSFSDLPAWDYKVRLSYPDQRFSMIEKSLNVVK